MNIQLKHFKINTLADGNIIYLIPLNKEKYDEIMKNYAKLSDQHSINKFVEKYGFKHTEMILDGNTYIDSNNKETLEIINPILSHILPHPKTIKNPINNHIERSYKCFCSKPLNLEDLTEHTTPLSSWNCLMIRVGEPEYAIILEEKVKK